MSEQTSPRERGKLCILPLVLIFATALSAAETPSGDSPPLMVLEQRRQRAEKLRPGLESLTGQFEALGFEAGARPKYTEYADVKHDSWVDTYTEPELSQWMFQQRREDDRSIRR